MTEESKSVSGAKSPTQRTMTPPGPPVQKTAPREPGEASLAATLFRVPRPNDDIMWPELFPRGTPVWGFPMLEDQAVDSPHVEVQPSRRVIVGREPYYDVFDDPIYFVEVDLPDIFVPISGVNGQRVHLNRGPVRRRGVPWKLKKASEETGTALGVAFSLRENGYSDSMILELLGENRNSFISGLPEEDSLRKTLFLSKSEEKEFIQTWCQLIALGEYTLSDFKESLDYLNLFRQGWDDSESLEDYDAGVQYLEEIREKFPEVAEEVQPLKVEFIDSRGEKIFQPDGYSCPVSYCAMATINVKAGSSVLFVQVDAKLQDALDAGFEYDRTITVYKTSKASVQMLEKFPENRRPHKTAANEKSQGRDVIVAGVELWRQVQKNTSGYLFQLSYADEKDGDRMNLILFYLSLLHEGGRHWTGEFIRSAFPPHRGNLNSRALEIKGWNSNFYPSSDQIVEKEILSTGLDRVELELVNGKPAFSIERVCRPEPIRDSLTRAWINRGPALEHIEYSQIDFERRAVLVAEKFSQVELNSTPLFYLYRTAGYNFKANRVGDFYPSEVYSHRGKIPVERARILSFNAQFLCFIKFELGVDLRCVYCGEPHPLLGPDDHSSKPRMSADHMIASAIAPDFLFDARDLIPMCTVCNSAKGTDPFSMDKVSSLVSDPFVTRDINRLKSVNLVSSVARSSRAKSPSTKLSKNASRTLSPKNVKIPLAKLEIKDAEVKPQRKVRRDSSGSENSLSGSVLTIGKFSSRNASKIHEGVYRIDKQLLALQAAQEVMALGEGVFHFSDKKLFLPYKGTKGYLTKMTPQVSAFYKKVKADYGVNHLVIETCSPSRVVPLHGDQHELLAQGYLYRCVIGDVRSIRFDAGFSLVPDEHYLYRFDSNLGKHSVPSGTGVRVCFTFRTLKDKNLPSQASSLSLPTPPLKLELSLPTAFAEGRSRSKTRKSSKSKSKKEGVRAWGDSDSEHEEVEKKMPQQPKIDIDPTAIVGTIKSTLFTRTYDSTAIISRGEVESKVTLNQSQSPKYNKTVYGVLNLAPGEYTFQFSKDSLALYIPNKQKGITYKGRYLPDKRFYPLVETLSCSEAVEIYVIYDAIVYLEYRSKSSFFKKPKTFDWLSTGEVSRNSEKTVVAKGFITEILKGLKAEAFENIAVASVSAPLEEWAARNWTNKSFIDATTTLPWKEESAMSVLASIAHPWGMSVKVDTDGHNFRAGGEPWMKFILCSRIKSV